MATRLRPGLGALLLMLVLTSCGGGDPQPHEAAVPSLAAEIVQLRRDQVLERIEVALENTGADGVVVESLHVRVPGFDAGDPVPKDSPVRAGQVVNLPWTYGKPVCGADGEPAVGHPVVTLWLRTRSDPAPRRVHLDAKDPGGLLEAIAVRACTVAQVSREVDLRFGDDWRVERAHGDATIHGTLDARLLTDQPRSITQVAGAIMYGLKPDDSAGRVRIPLAALTATNPSASIPVQAFAARCDPHTIGEIKKPYEFLVWVGAPGEEGFAVTPTVGTATKQALRQVCAF